MKRKLTFVLVALCLSLTAAVSVAASPRASADDPATYYTLAEPLGTVDFAASELVTERATDTYTGTGEVALCGDNAIGATVDKTFTMSFFWDADDTGSGSIMVRTTGWADGPQVRLDKDGTIKVGYTKGGDTFVTIDAADKTAFAKNEVYRLEYTPYTLYSDTELQTPVGLRLVAYVYNDDKSYEKTVTGDFTNLPADMGIDTGNLILFINGEMHNHHLASIEYDPNAEPPTPPDPVTYYTKPAAEIGTVDLAALELFNDPVRDTFDTTGERAVYDKGTTINKKLTMTFFWSGEAETWPSIMVRTAGTADDFQVRIQKDGTIKVGHNRLGDTAYTVVEEKTAFVTGTVYYLEYTIEHLYTDEACTEVGGVRQTAYVYDAGKTYEKTVTRDTAPIPANVNCTANSFILFINAEMSNQHLGSFQYDPNASTVEYVPVTTLDAAEKVDISKKLAMNAAGLDKDALFTEEADGFYANRTGVYEINKTLRFAVQGAGEMHFALSGNWIWNSYKMDLDFTQNLVKLDNGKNITPSHALSTTQKYIVELTVIEYKNSETQEKHHETVTCKIYYMDGNSEVVLVNETQKFSGPPGLPDDGSRGYFGIYMGKTGNDLHLYPVDFERDYAVTLVNGDAEQQQAFSYGEDYDIAAYAPAKAAYTFTGWRYYEGGEAKMIPSAGTWTVDFTTQVGGVYSGTLTAVYTPIDYDVTYVVDVALGENSDDNPDKINIESGEITLAAPTTQTGYVFFGWYDNASFTGDPIETIEYTGEDITVYAKIAEGVYITLAYPDGSERVVGVGKNAVYTFPTETVAGYGAITGWEKKDGDNWTAVTGTSVTPTVDSTYRAVAAPIQYTITYALDGGSNGENPATFTIADTITFAPAVKAGYFFVGWFDGETQVRGIAKGSTGNLTVTARYVEDTLPATLTVAAGSTVLLPVPSNLPQGSRYAVTAADAAGTALTVTANSCVFATAGTYKLTYTLTLPAATYTREVTVTAATPALTLAGTYETSYAVGTELTLLAATCNIEGREVSVAVTKDDQTVTVTDGKLTLEAGTYTVTYTAEGAEPISVTFTVAAAAEKKGCGCGSAAFGGLWAAGLLALGAMALLLLRRKRA